LRRLLFYLVFDGVCPCSYACVEFLCLYRIDLILAFDRRRLLTRLFVEEFFLEQKNGDDPYGNRSIGNIEDGAEEFEILSPDKRHPLRIMCFDEREIEHIHHPAMQKSSISVRWKYLCHMLIGALLEDQAVEHAVQEIAQGPGKDEAGANDKAAVIFLLDDRLNVINTEDHRDQAEKGERHLAPGAAEFPAPGHPFILDEIDLRLVTRQLYTIVIRRDGITKKVRRVTERHVCLYPDFEGLICNDDQQYQ
jgi:hypothetical protein